MKPKSDRLLDNAGMPLPFDTVLERAQPYGPKAKAPAYLTGRDGSGTWARFALSASETAALTVEGELNKLAQNVAMGRAMGGVHWRSDNSRSLILGEAIAAEMLAHISTDSNEHPALRSARSRAGPTASRRPSRCAAGGCTSTALCTRRTSAKSDGGPVPPACRPPAVGTAHSEGGRDDDDDTTTRRVCGSAGLRVCGSAGLRTIMAGDATAAQIAGLLVALRMKGETIDEIAAAASVTRELAQHVEVGITPLIDTCGTGGDGIGTFNISIAAAFVTAAAGGHIAKHGNRAASGASGSADVLEAAGARIDLSPSEVADCVRTVGVGFMFAPAHHGATRHAAVPRRELGTRTLFNVLGPLTNPANASVQLMGVYDLSWVTRAAEVLRLLGVARAMVVCAEDGMDEISIGALTHAAELRDGVVTSFVIDPRELGMAFQPLAGLAAKDPQASLAHIHAVFDNQAGAARDIVALNAGAAIYLAGLAPDLAAGVARAREVLASGAARDCFARFIAHTQTFPKH